MKRVLCDQIGFKFQLCSDIHLERGIKISSYKSIINNNSGESDVLFLAGDIGNPFSKSIKNFIKYTCENWKYVIHVNGNHEFYQTKNNIRTVNESRNQMQKLALEFDNLFVLDPGVIMIGGVCVIGATLWSYIPSYAKLVVSDRMNDYAVCFKETSPKYINLSVDDTIEQHEKDLEFITKHITTAIRMKQKTIVVTHHAPSLEHTSAKIYQGIIQNPTTHAFATNLQYLFKNCGQEDNSTVDWWLFGHTHHNCKEIQHGTLLYSNQYGYGGQSSGNSYRSNDINKV